MWGNEVFQYLYVNLEQAVGSAETYIKQKAQEAADAVLATVEWIWEAIQGDFNEDMSAGQIAANTALGLIPIVDQVLDIRDIIANCKKINDEPDDKWAWVALVLTLIGFIPTLGSAVKGVLKIIFLFLRKEAGDMAKILGRAMKAINSFLLDSRVQKVTGHIRVSTVLESVVEAIGKIKGSLSLNQLLGLFDSCISTFSDVIQRVKGFAPDEVIEWMTSALHMIESVRQSADKMLPDAIKEAVYKLDDLELALKKKIRELDAPNQALPDTKSLHRLDASVEEITPEIIVAKSNKLKGIYGEIISDHFMESHNFKQGYKFTNLLPEERRVRKMTDKPRGRGIDGIYQNANPPPPYVITETKYRTESGQYIDDEGMAKDSVLSMTKHSGKQMSDDWIGPRLADSLSQRDADLISDSDYERWLMIVDSSGEVINITKLNENAESIGIVLL